MEAEHPFETILNFYKFTWSNLQEDITIDSHHMKGSNLTDTSNIPNTREDYRRLFFWILNGQNFLSPCFTCIWVSIKFKYYVACFLGNATRKFTWVSDLDEYLLDDHSLHSQIQLFTLITSSDVSSSMLYTLALGAQMSLALVGYELTGLLSKLDCHILHSC
jgi:hypothetical protein